MGVPKAGGRSLRLRSGFAGKRQLDEKRQMLHRYQLRKNQWQSARVTKCSQAVGRQGIEAPLFNPIVALDTALFIVAWQENRLGLDQGVFSQQLAGFLRPLAIGLNMTEEVHHFAHALCRLPPFIKERQATGLRINKAAVHVDRQQIGVVGTLHQQEWIGPVGGRDIGRVPGAICPNQEIGHGKQRLNGDGHEMIVSFEERQRRVEASRGQFLQHELAETVLYRELVIGHRPPAQAGKLVS